MDKIPCYLSLSSGANVLYNIQDIVPSVLRVVLGTTAGSSELFERERMSFRSLESLYGKTPTDLTSAFSESFDKILRNYVPYTTIQTHCYTEPYDPENPNDGRYVLFISVTAIVGANKTASLISSHRVRVNPDTHDFDIIYPGETDRVRQ